MWIRVSDLLPPAGDEVETQNIESDDDSIKVLVRRGPRWYTLDGELAEMPTHWRYPEG